MRRSWIALALIALMAVIAGIIVVYRVESEGEPPRASEPESSVRQTQREVPALLGRTPETSEPKPTRSERAGAAAARDLVPPVAVSVASASASRVVPPSAPTGIPIPEASSTSAPVDSQNAHTAKREDAPAAKDDPDSDRLPPVLQELRFNLVQVAGGVGVMLSVVSHDDLSGVDSVSGMLRSPSDAASLPFVARGDSEIGVFSAAILIPRQAETGEWFVGLLRIVDKAGNALSLTYSRATVPPGGVLRVVSDDSDATAPAVRGVSLEKWSVDAGEANRIVIDVEDDRSGVASVSGSFQSPSKSGFIPFTCVPQGDSSSWAAGVVVPADADCGEWTLKMLRVADKANNAAFLEGDSSEVGHVSFSVSGSGACDSEAPVVDAIGVTPTVVSNISTTQLTLTVKAHDDASGLSSCTGRIEGPAAANGQGPSIYFESQPDPRDPAGPLITLINVPQYAAKGVWRVALLQLMDKARNARSYAKGDPVLANGSFTVE